MLSEGERPSRNTLRGWRYELLSGVFTKNLPAATPSLSVTKHLARRMLQHKPAKPQVSRSAGEGVAKITEAFS
jgi:hypothetical protein